eukprot:TRINITY_DN5785_c0_g1_i1.p1 TRINITY_DN5785_c0_g1~~TRINITY_DN5785_c0_g1_i1.p1  ORF type:complete len:585 (+),score=155.44 TRINITY_DN5785_c0_g1_i1:226-1755(+)
MQLAVAAAGAAGAAAACSADTSEDVENWSSTHKVTTKLYLKPESTEEVEQIIAGAHKADTKVRVVGNALSPNAIGLSTETMLTLALCDKVLSVDPIQKTVRVQAGARVQQVVDALTPYNLTLQNYASISEQQIGGFLQVGAHGTGVTIPPVDEQIISMRLVTPGLGAIELSEDSDPDLFRLAKVGLGALGVVTEVTIQCVPRHLLTEKTWVLTRAEVKAQHRRLLKENRHIRYMWIPYADAVVVVACNPAEAGAYAGAQSASSGDSGADDAKPLVDLLLSCPGQDAEQVRGMGFGELRDKLLAADPLNAAWVARVNAAEAAFWRQRSGTRTDYSDRVLGFDCGGQQWVNEVALPAREGADLNYVLEVLALIEERNVPAPAPIEQRWTAPSAARMSPARAAGGVASWVGIIMYLPSDEAQQRSDITGAFFAYRDLCKEKLWDRYECTEHWAKIEKPDTPEEAAALQARLRRHYPVNEFNAARRKLDPQNIMANDHIDALFGTGRWTPQQQ